MADTRRKQHGISKKIALIYRKNVASEQKKGREWKIYLLLFYIRFVEVCYLVFGGNKAGLKALEELLPKDKYVWTEKEVFRSSAHGGNNSDLKTEQAKGVELLIMNYDPKTGEKL